MDQTLDPDLETHDIDVEKESFRSSPGRRQTAVAGSAHHGLFAVETGRIALPAAFDQSASSISVWSPTPTLDGDWIGISAAVIQRQSHADETGSVNRAKHSASTWSRSRSLGSAVLAAAWPTCSWSVAA